MRALFAVAALLLASTAAQAQYTFEYGGRTIRIDPDRGTVSIPGVYDNTGRKAKRSRDDQDSERPRKRAPQQAKSDPQAPATPQAPAAQPAPAPAAGAAATPAATANVAPADTAISTQPAASAPPSQPQQVAPPAAAQPAPAPVLATAPPAPAPAPSPQAATPAAMADSPLGVWLTEEKEGKVRIEQCGANLCGYSVDAKSNRNGEQVLINMKPGKDSKWRGTDSRSEHRQQL